MNKHIRFQKSKPEIKEEKIILSISKKELHALVWLGGLLGMLMGFVNLLF